MYRYRVAKILNRKKKTMRRLAKKICRYVLWRGVQELVVGDGRRATGDGRRETATTGRLAAGDNTITKITSTIIGIGGTIQIGLPGR